MYYYYSLIFLFAGLYCRSVSSEGCTEIERRYIQSHVTARTVYKPQLARKPLDRLNFEKRQQHSSAVLIFTVLVEHWTIARCQLYITA
jgi:hypothetical protein